MVVGNIDPYGQVWRTGANGATRITFSAPVNFGGTEVPAGTYGLFTIPGADRVDRHPEQERQDSGAPTPTTPRTTSSASPPRRSNSPRRSRPSPSSINDIRDESATLNLIWADWRVPVKLGVDVVSVLEPQIEAVMASDAPKKPYAQAAMFYGDHNLHLPEAATWMDAAIAAQPDAFYLLYHKAIILEKMGDKAGAEAAARQSMALAAKQTGPEKDEYLRLNEALLARLP